MTGSVRRWVQSGNFVPLVVLLAPVVIWIRTLLQMQSILGGGDNRYYFYPMTSAGMAQWRTGMVPLWTTGIQSGFPLLADGQGALLYPLNLLAHLTLPSPLAYNLVIAVQVVLAAVLMYALIRTLGTGRWAAVVAGWMYVFAGPIGPNLGSPALNGLVWWPLLFLLAERVARQPGARLISAAGAVMGITWLGGFPQTALYGIAAASGYLVVRLFPKDRMELRSAVLSIGGWVSACCAGIGVAAIQLLPTLEMSSFSVRAGGVDFSLASQGSMFPSGFAGFLLPTWSRLGDYGLAGTNQYITLIGLAGVLLTWRRIRERPILFFWALAMVGCLLSLGKFNPVYRWIYDLPGLHYLRIPSRFLYWTSFSLAVLSAYGLDRIFASHAGEIRRAISYLGVIVGITLAGTFTGMYILRLKWNTLVHFAQEHVSTSLLGQSYRLQNRAYYGAKIERMFADISEVLNPANPKILCAIALAFAAGALLWVWLRRPGLSRWLQTGLLSVLLLDLGSLAAGRIRMASPDYLSGPPLARRIAGQKGDSRLYEVITQSDIVSRVDKKLQLAPDYNLLFGIDHAGVYSALGSSRYYDLLHFLGGVNLAFGQRVVNGKDLERNRPLLDLLNVRYVVSSEPLDAAGLRQELFGPPYLYRNEQALPRAFVVPAAQVVSGPAEALRILQSSSFDPASVVLIESPSGPASPRGIRSDAKITIYEENHIALLAEGPGWLVLTDTDYPGWRAQLDGRDVKIWRGDYAFRTLPLPSGSHRVEFTFGSKSFQSGAALSGFSMICLILIFFIGGRKRSGL